MALVSHLQDGRRYIDIVDSVVAVPFGPGDSDPLAETYCQPIADGELPEIIRNTSQNAQAMSIAATSELNIRAHLGVPVVLEDGTVYGTLCAYSHDIRDDLTAHSGTLMGLVADTVARAIGSALPWWCGQLRHVVARAAERSHRRRALVDDQYLP